MKETSMARPTATSAFPVSGAHHEAWDEEVPVPQAALALKELNWDRAGLGRLSAKVIYGPRATALRVLSYGRPVLCDGIPSAVVIFSGSDEKTRLITARRLAKLSGFGAHGETLRQLESLNSGFAGVVVQTAAWAHRDSLINILLSALDQDQALQRMILRGGMQAERADLDSKVLKTFVLRGGGVARHFAGPRVRQYRFSDFKLTDTVNIGVGTHFKLEFDDFEIMDFALERFRSFLEGFEDRAHPCKLHLEEPRTAADASSPNTDILWGDLSFTLSAGLNKPVTRMQAFNYLAMVCGLDGGEIPLAESLWSELSANRGYPNSMG